MGGANYVNSDFIYCISYTVFVYCLLGSFSSSVILQRRPSHFTSFQVEFKNGDQHEKALRIDVL